MVHVVVLFEQGFCDGCHGALSIGMRQHHVLPEPAESSLLQHHAALDRVTELQRVVHLAHEGPPTTTTRDVTRLIGPPTRIPCFSSSRASAICCGKSRAYTFCTRRSRPSAFINLSSPFSVAHDKASPRKASTTFAVSAGELICLA